MDRIPSVPAAEKVMPFEEAYRDGRQYDCPVSKRPKFGEVGIEGSHGIRYNTYHGGDAQIGALGDKLVLMQVEGYWFQALPASEIEQEFKKRTPDFQRDCMVFVPQE